MKSRTAAGYIFETNSHTYKYVEPFCQILIKMGQNKHIDRANFCKLHSLTEEEFFDLIARAENYFISVDNCGFSDSGECGCC